MINTDNNRFDIEMSVIGALLINNEKSQLDKAFSMISNEYFEMPQYKNLFDSIKKQYNDNDSGKINPVVAVNSLGTDYDYRNIAAQCMDYVPSGSLLLEYVENLVTQYRIRIMYNTCNQVIGELATGYNTDTIQSAMCKLQSLMNLQNEYDNKTEHSTSLEMLDMVVEHLNFLKSKGTEQEHKTGIKLLDYVLGGICSKSVTVISGRSGMGKTDIAVFLAVSLANKGAKVLYLTMEMPRTQLMARIASRITKINSTKLRDRSLSESEFNLVAKAEYEIAGIPLIADEEQNLSVEAIAQKVKKHNADIVVIDHLGLMNQEGKRNPWEAVAENSKKIKQLAMKENIAVIELVQQTREVDGRKNKGAFLSDLKGSDCIGNDADTVMFIRAEKDDNAGFISGDQYIPAFLQIAKNRHGAVGTIPFNWYPQYHDYIQIDTRKPAYDDILHPTKQLVEVKRI